MLLAVNIGNSTVAFGVYGGGKLETSFRAVTRTQGTADEYGTLLQRLLGQRGLELGDLTGCALASVVPSLTPSFVEMVQRYLDRNPVVVGAPGVRIGMSILTEVPPQVGADRIVSALAARELYGKPAIVVDFGTATTLNAISPEGDFLGGAIAPGVQIAADALSDRTAKLPRIDLALPERAIGRNTVTSMQAGVLYGHVGLVEELVRRMTAELGQEATVVATGGFAPLIAPLAHSIDVLHQHLTLEGLRMVYELNGERIYAQR
jgi:type III pantothenate kinase